MASRGLYTAKSELGGCKNRKSRKSLKAFLVLSFFMLAAMKVSLVSDQIRFASSSHRRDIGVKKLQFQNYREIGVAYSSAYQDIRNETDWSPATLRGRKASSEGMEMAMSGHIYMTDYSPVCQRFDLMLFPR
jgi:hypothetical protein